MERPFLSLCMAACLLSCGGGESADPPGRPVLEMTLAEKGGDFVTLSLSLLRADAAYCLVLEDWETAPSSASLLLRGKACSAGTVRLDGLQPQTGYIAYGCAENGGRTGSVQSVAFRTGISEASLYAWERSRTAVPSFADLVLLYGSDRRSGGQVLRWTQERATPLVTWNDPEVGEKWLFDAFLVLEGTRNDRTFMLGNLEDRAALRARPAGRKEDAQYFIDWWFLPGNGFVALDAAIAEAAGRIGEPPAPRYAIMMMPDISIHERYNDVSSSTTYWGDINGHLLDFSDPSDRQQAYKWYIDEVRRRFDEAGFRYLQLGGFYIMTEELPSEKDGEGAAWGERGKDGWEQQYKRWDQVFPAVSDYAHQYRECITWIPYFRAAGYRYFKDFGIDWCYMQPNYYWDDEGKRPISSFYPILDRETGLAMEMECDDLMLASSTTAEVHRSRWRSYIDGFRTHGIYGQRPSAWYQDTDTFNHLRQSPDPTDRAAYVEICRLIADNPLKSAGW